MGAKILFLRSLAANAHAAGQRLIAGGEGRHRLIVHLEELRIVLVARADQKTVQRFVAVHDQEGRIQVPLDPGAILKDIHPLE